MTEEIRGPTVSVVVPFYNRREWLGEAIRSVLDQTYKDFEVVVVDDGSDVSLESCPGSEDPRVRCVRQEHKGRSAARNCGIAVSRGQLVAFLDSDDTFSPAKLESQVGLMLAHPGCMLSHTSYERMDPEGRRLEVVHSGLFRGEVYPDIVNSCPIATPTVMVRRAALDSDTRFEESLEVGEDVILWSLVARKSAVLGIDEPLTRVRIHAASAAMDAQAQITGQISVIKYVIRTDAGLRWWRRRELLSGAYTNIGWAYFSMKKFGHCLWYLGRAFVAWPFNRRLFADICRGLARRVKGGSGG